MNRPNRRQTRAIVSILRMVFGSILLSAIVLITIALYSGAVSIEVVVRTLEAYPLIAPVIFVLIYFAMTAVLIPTLPMNLVAGFLWGTIGGGLITLTAVGLGAACTFLLARHFGEKHLGRWLQFRAWRWLDKEVSRKGWIVVAFTRISPVFPTAVLNYLYGITNVKFWPYFVATLVGLAPWALFFAAMGSAARGVLLDARGKELLQEVFVVSLVATLIILVIYGLARTRHVYLRMDQKRSIDENKIDRSE